MRLLHLPHQSLCCLSVRSFRSSSTDDWVMGGLWVSLHRIALLDRIRCRDIFRPRREASPSTPRRGSPAPAPSSDQQSFRDVSPNSTWRPRSRRPTGQSREIFLAITSRMLRPKSIAKIVNSPKVAGSHWRHSFWDFFFLSSFEWKTFFCWFSSFPLTTNAQFSFFT